MSAARSLIDMGSGVTLERRVACLMQDGVTLYADHYYPPGNGRWPTLLMRQPYGRDIASTVVYAHPVWFARHGYNVVIQDVRGRGASEGEFFPFRNEARDGAATIGALRQRPESNGRIGMYGFSYQGMTQLLAAAEQPEGLQCIAPAMTAHDLYRGWFYMNGALRLASTLGWGLQMLKEDARRLGLVEQSAQLEGAWANLPAQYRATPYGKHPAVTGEGLPTYLQDWIESNAPGQYWEAMDLSQNVAKILIPALHLSGWYDTYQEGSIRGFRAMCREAGTEHARSHQYLLAGPWVHIPWGDQIAKRSLGPEARFDTDALLLRWFDHWLKDADSFRDEPRIRHFALGEGKWHAAPEFPQAGYSLYLHSGGRANSSKGDGALCEQVGISQPPDIFVYDPEVPVMAPGGPDCSPGPIDQAASEMGNNLLIYTTESLTQPLHVFGSVEVEIFFSSSAASADLVIKLIRVCNHLQDGGEAIFIAIGIARSEVLFGGDYAADRIALWRFSLEATSCVFAAGERLRIEIASSAYPLFDRNPGSSVKAAAADSWSWRRSTQIVFHDAHHPSLIRLPLAEEGGHGG